MDDLPDTCYDYRYEQPNAKVFCECDWCGDPIYEGDVYYIFEGMNICIGCMTECRRIAGEE